MHVPDSTYRIQLNKEFDFSALKGLADYFSKLGVSDIYASPIFKSRKGSMHGYDVVDHSEIDAEIGSLEEFRGLISSFKEKGLSWLQDIVPNHMAFDSENRILMDVLENGRSSRYFNFFDIDWESSCQNLKDRLLAPFLGRFYSESLEDAEISLFYEEGGFSIKYYSLKLPLKISSYGRILERGIEQLEGRVGRDNPQFAKFLGIVHLLKAVSSESQQEPGNSEHISHAKKMLWGIYSEDEQIRGFIEENISAINGEKGNAESFNELDKLIGEQLFRLSFWKVAAEEINYRRFFTINELICLRVEEEAVFEYTHKFLVSLIKEGLIHGLRVDHIDGLYDPQVYLERLKESCPDTYLVAEKILAEKESIPGSWELQGTTGYDFMNYINRFFCRSASEKDLTKIYYKFTGQHAAYDELVSEKKRLIIGKHLAGNVDNLAQMLKKISVNDRYGRDITLYGLKRALVEVMAQFSVYRTYVTSSGLSPQDKAHIQQALEKAKARMPGLFYEFNFIEKYFTVDFPEGLSQAEREERVAFVMNLQQYIPPLMAKGFEDTILYVYNRLISLNEVGGDPKKFGSTAEEFHEFNIRRHLENRHTMNATSTHDSKRGEDVRARINVLSEIPGEWDNCLKRWSRVNKKYKKKISDKYAPDENDEYSLYQSLIGSLPEREGDLAAFGARAKDYMIKAVREAKVHTAWIKPDTDYEQACLGFIDSILMPSADNRFLDDFLSFHKKIAHFGYFNSLSQLVLKTASVGVPDFYQGSELWDLNFVDPDNRRSVDYRKRSGFLDDVISRQQPDLQGLLSELLREKQDGRIKLYLMHKCLSLRRRYP